MLNIIHHIYSGTLSRIICSQEECVDTFTRTSSFKRHLLSQHKALVRDNNNEQTGTADISETVGSAIQDAEEEPIPMHEDCQIVDAIAYSKETAALFIANLKATSISFSAIQTIINEVQELFSSLMECIHERASKIKPSNNLESDINQYTL